MALDIFFREQCNKRNADAVERAIYYLAAHRLVDPASILSSSRDQENYAGLTPLGLDVFYQVLDTLSQHKEAVIEHLNRFFEKNTGERYDGYYAVITNRLDYNTEEVTKIYSGLWQIEETFRVLKTDLRARPVFVWSDDHIQGHFTLADAILDNMHMTGY